MACKECEDSSQKDGVAYYRWKHANIGMLGCNAHLREIFEVLTTAQTKEKEDRDAIK